MSTHTIPSIDVIENDIELKTIICSACKSLHSPEHYSVPNQFLKGSVVVGTNGDRQYFCTTICSFFPNRVQYPLGTMPADRPFCFINAASR